MTRKLRSDRQKAVAVRGDVCKNMKTCKRNATHPGRFGRGDVCKSMKPCKRNATHPGRFGRGDVCNNMKTCKRNAIHPGCFALALAGAASSRRTFKSPITEFSHDAIFPPAALAS